jgi:orotidine-5'-phosphate decarboxylase
VTETHPYAACFKPNCAFFERFGGPGVEALKSLIAAIPKDIPVLLDCKRGDIDTTAQVGEVGLLFISAWIHYVAELCFSASPPLQ